MNNLLFDEVVTWLDKEILPKDRVTSQQKRSFKNFYKLFILIKGRLMRKIKWNDPVKVIKQEKEGPLLFLYHDDLTVGHLEEKKVLNRLKRNFFWPNIGQDIKQHI